jgi:hypothetical protein
VTVELDLQHVVGASRASVCPVCRGGIQEGDSVTWHAFHSRPVHADCETVLTADQRRQLRNEQAHYNPVLEEDAL